MNWYLIGAGIISLFLARQKAVEVRFGIDTNRRTDTIAEDAFFGGFYFSIGITLIAGAIMFWGGLL